MSEDALGPPAGYTVDPQARIDKLTFMLGAWTGMVGAGRDRGASPPEGSPLLPPDLAGEYVGMLAARLDGGRAPMLRLAADCRAGDEAACRWAGWLAQQAVDALPSLLELVEASFADADYTVAKRTATFALSALTATGRSAESLVWLWWAGRCSWRLGQVDATVEHLQQAVAIPVDETTRATVCKAADLLGLALSAAHRPQDAVRAHARAVALVREPGSRATVLSNQSQTLATAGYYARAEVAAEQAYEAVVQAEVAPQQRGILLDTWSAAAVGNGDVPKARRLAAQAETHLATAPLGHRTINLLVQAQLAGLAGDLVGRRTTYERAYDLAAAGAADGLDVRRYRDGYARWVQTQLPEDHPALVRFEEGLWRRAHEEYEASAACFDDVASAAAQAGDILLRLRAVINLAASLLEANRIDAALHVTRWVRDGARAHGLALMQAMASGNLASLYSQGGEGSSESDVLLLNHEALVLQDVHRLVHDELGRPNVRGDRPFDPGGARNSLGLQARRYGAVALGARLLRAALTDAVAFGNAQAQGTRTVNLLHCLLDDEDVALPGELARLAETLQAVVSDDDAQLAVRVPSRMALDRWQPASPEDLEQATVLLEQLRSRQPAGADRAALDGRYDVWSVLTERLFERGRRVEAWEALQHTRARELMEVLTAQTGQQAPYVPPSLGEARNLVGALRSTTFLVDVRLTGAGLDAFIIGPDGMQLVRADADLAGRPRIGWGEPLHRAADAMSVVRSGPFRELVARISDTTGPDADVLVSVDDALANLPVHAVPVEGGSWGARQRVSRVPAVGTLRFWADDPRPSASLVAGDSSGDLRGAAAECRAVAASLDVRPLLGAECSLSALQELGGRELDVLHLAVHGYADPSSGSTCSLLLAQPDGSTGWVAWEELAALPWRARTVVLSGCSTGVGGPRHGRGLYSITSTALRAGARAVIASLWPVDDHLTSAYMAAMYEHLAAQREAAATSGGAVDLRDGMAAGAAAIRDSAAAATDMTVRDAREFDLGELPDAARRAAASVSDAFVLIGDPTC